MLCQKEVPSDSIDLALILLNEFASRFEDLYEIETMTCNLHHIRHLATMVRRIDPLWTMSCFPLENLNGKLSALVHSSNSAHLQICTVLSLYMNLFILKSELCKPNTEIFELVNRILSIRRKKLTSVSPSMATVGKLLPSTNVIDEISTLVPNYEINNIYLF